MGIGETVHVEEFRSAFTGDGDRLSGGIAEKSSGVARREIWEPKNFLVNELIRRGRALSRAKRYLQLERPEKSKEAQDDYRSQG